MAFGGGIARVITRFAVSRTIRRFADRRTQTYDSEGDPISLPVAVGTINIHDQPIGDGKLIKDLSEGQRLQDMRKGWTFEVIKEKDILDIDGFAFTVNAVKEYPGIPGHTECDLLRTGEQDNVF